MTVGICFHCSYNSIGDVCIDLWIKLPFLPLSKLNKKQDMKTMRVNKHNKKNMGPQSHVIKFYTVLFVNTRSVIYKLNIIGLCWFCSVSVVSKNKENSTEGDVSPASTLSQNIQSHTA